jgi:hypothetical protein
MAATALELDVDKLLELGKALSDNPDNVDALLKKAETEIQDVRIQSIAQEALMSKASFEKNVDFAHLALQAACMLGCEDVACSLIEKDVAIDGRDSHGNTVATWVGRKSLKTVAKLMRAKGKGIKLSDGLFDSMTPMAAKNIVKMVAHIWGIKDKTKEARKYESWQRDVALQYALPWLTDFFESPEFAAVNSLSKEEIAEIELAMERAITSESSSKLAKDDSLIVQLTGWDGHATSVVYVKVQGDKPEDQGWLVLKGNRGARASYSNDDHAGISGIQLYVVTKPDNVAAVIEALKNPDDPDEFLTDMDDTLGLEKIDISIPMKKQKTGNCTWSSGVECALLSTLFVVFLKKHQDTGVAIRKAKQVYKAFTTDFVRRRSLEKYVQHVKNPDKELLALIKAKITGKESWDADFRRSLLETVDLALQA